MAGLSFDDAVVGALDAGAEEIANLAGIVDRAVGAYERLARKASAMSGVQDGLLAEFVRMDEVFVAKAQSHLAKQREVLSTFNVAFFGRTGAGKSTLLAAFGELDGSGASPMGASDWTEDVQTVSWRGCTLYDTPGINGWGRRKNRELLEATARSAVETADVVLLCFDSQSQQASEFTKVAEWVRHYGKPTIAVLNVRNLRWRHPARIADQGVRRTLSTPVRQHAENIRTELANIGLVDTPVVAIQSRRALFARAAEPYRGPAPTDFAFERETFGRDYLARWSNFGTLETLLSAGIAAGGKDLRLTSLREGMRAVLVDEAQRVRALVDRVEARTAELDRLVARHLEVLGYLDDQERAVRLRDDEWHGDLLTLVETARGKPYRTPKDGGFAQHVRTLLKPHLAGPRNKALRRCREVEKRAFEAHDDVAAEEFAAEVFDEDEIQAALNETWCTAANYLARELDLATSELRHSGATSERGKVLLEGGAGSTAHVFENVLRAGGLVTGTAATALGIVALTNAWNPAGWVAAAVLGGIGAAAQVMQWVGGWAGDSGNKLQAEARARAVFAGRSAVHDTFDRIEKSFVERARDTAWQAIAEALRPLLRDFVSLSMLGDELRSLAMELDADAADIAGSPQTDILAGARGLLLENLDTSRGAAQALDRLLVGEDWLDDAAPSVVDAADHHRFHDACAVQNSSDAGELSAALAEAVSMPTPNDVVAWMSRLRERANVDDSFGVAADAAAVVTTASPVVAILGDFSAGKSSFVKRLIAEFAGEAAEAPEIRADPTTAQVRGYQVDGFGLLDTPGFQSGRDHHDQRAMDGAHDAAIIIVLLHVNLLIGETKQLEGLAKGTSHAPGRQPRMLFLINRCDELGIDPVNDLNEYFHRRDRKERELASALASRGIEVPAARIHGIASDPYAIVGSRWPVTRSDYADNASWDGIAPLITALRSLTAGQREHAARLAVFDQSCAALLRLRGATEDERREYGAEVIKHDSLIAALGICLDDAVHLDRSLEDSLRQTMARHTIPAIQRIREAPQGDRAELRKQSVSWAGPEAKLDVGRFMVTARDQIADWVTTHESAINREFASADFDGTLELTDPSLPVSETIGGIGAAANVATKTAKNVASIFENRDAFYAAGKFIGHKFKPWGAVKGSAAVARVGVVLSAVTVVLDGASWAMEQHTRNSWQAECDAAADAVDEAAIAKADELLRGEEGPLTYLSGRRADVDAILETCNVRRTAALEQVAVRERRLAEIEQLLTLADQMRGRTPSDTGD